MISVRRPWSRDAACASLPLRSWALPGAELQAAAGVPAGDSILGNDVNLGAGTRLANFKIVPGTIAVRHPDGASLDTGLRKLGALLGDGVQIGCNAVTSPGTVIGRESIVYPGASLQGTIPPRSVVTWKPRLVIRPLPRRADVS